MAGGTVIHRLRHRAPTTLGPVTMGLVIAQALTLVLGIAFWAVAARNADLSEVGRAGLFVATTSSLASLSNLGAGSVLERFLPRAGSSRRPVLLVTYAVTLSTTMVTAAAFTWIDPVPGLFARSSSQLLFVLLAAATSLFALLDSVLIGLGAGTWVMAKNVGHGLVKLIVLVAVAAGMTAVSASAIVLAWLAPTAGVAAVLVVLLAAGRAPWQVSPTEAGSWMPTRGGLLSFWGPTYVWLLLGSVPGFVVPVVVGREAGLDQAAYFSVAWSLVTASNGIVAIASAPFVAGATRAPTDVAALVRSFAVTMTVLNVGRAAGLAVVGPLILGVYGEQFRQEASPLLWAIAVAHALSAPAYVYGGLARVYRRVLHPMLVQAVASIAVVLTVIVLVPAHGLMAVAAAYVLQEVLVLVLASPRLARTWGLARSGAAP